MQRDINLTHRVQERAEWAELINTKTEEAGEVQESYTP